MEYEYHRSIYQYVPISLSLYAFMKANANRRLEGATTDCRMNGPGPSGRVGSGDV